MLVLIYLIATTLVANFIPPLLVFYYYILANSGLLILTVAKAKRRGIELLKRSIRLRTFGSPLQLAAYIATLQVVLAVSLGFVIGFGKSPHSLKPIPLLTNVAFLTTSILGAEISRAYLLRKFGRKFRSKSVLVVSIATLYFVLSMSSFTLPRTSPLELLKFFGYKIVPTFAQQLFATMLAFFGGARASITYFAIVRSFEWFSPLLPDLDWTLNAFISTIPSVTGYFLLERETEGKKVKVANESLASWAATAAASILLLLFFTGSFGYHPAIVGSGSMRPAIDVGDVVIVQHVNPDELKVGDVVQYYSGEGYTITHRIVDIRETAEGKIFITKGDANELADTPFTEDRIVGKVVFVIPKLGYLPLLARKLADYYAGM